ncbi:MAG: 1,6-anhydro-N-acetylmuramyl-L-alanine amidase AmpD [Betaproteobacteria bacterium]
MSRVVDGWLQGAERLPTPNVDDRPAGAPVELVVIHNISLPPGAYGLRNVHALFTNALDPSAHPFFATVAGARVSAHLLIERDGTTTQFASFDRRAWHAGASEFDGRQRCNDFSVGIELEGSDFDAYTDAQYDALNDALAALVRHYPVRAVRGHSDIAAGRKTDPGPRFDWSRLALPGSVSLPSVLPPLAAR